jgi:hypothetical protein
MEMDLKKLLLGCVYSTWVVTFAKLAFALSLNAGLTLLLLGFTISGWRAARNG